MTSAIYYYILAFNLIGASLIFIGLRNHYLIKKIADASVIDTGYYALAYTVIMFPLTLIVVKEFLRTIRPRRSVKVFIEEDIHVNCDMTAIQNATVFLMGICTLATIYVFMHLGYVPIIAMFKGGNLDAMRQSGSRFFQGNQYIKNLFMVTLTPFVSYLTYIYFRVTKSKTWLVMFIYMAFLSVIVLTYDFSKSPIITYLLGIYLIEVVMGNIKNSKRFNRLALASVALLLFFYVIVSNAGSSLFSIYSGPLGRILFTQIATMFLHFDAFPAKTKFLNGASFNSWMSPLFPAAAGERSGRVVMGIYNAKGIQDNTAGVMNTVFIGEAYANFGFTGVIVAPIIFGIIIGLFAYGLPNLKKRPTTLLIYVQMTLIFTTIIEGGFVDIFYSASAVFLIAMTILLSILSGAPFRKEKTALGRQRENMAARKENNGQ